VRLQRWNCLSWPSNSHCLGIFCDARCALASSSSRTWARRARLGVCVAFISLFADVHQAVYACAPHGRFQFPSYARHAHTTHSFRIHASRFSRLPAGLLFLDLDSLIPFLFWPPAFPLSLPPCLHASWVHAIGHRARSGRPWLLGLAHMPLHFILAIWACSQRAPRIWPTFSLSLGILRHSASLTSLPTFAVTATHAQAGLIHAFFGTCMWAGLSLRGRLIRLLVTYYIALFEHTNSCARASGHRRIRTRNYTLTLPALLLPPLEQAGLLAPASFLASYRSSGVARLAIARRLETRCRAIRTILPTSLLFCTLPKTRLLRLLDIAHGRNLDAFGPRVATTSLTLEHLDRCLPRWYAQDLRGHLDLPFSTSFL